MPTAVEGWVLEAFWMLLIGVGAWVVMKYSLRWIKGGSE